MFLVLLPVVINFVFLSCKKDQIERPSSYFARSHCYGEELSFLMVDGEDKWIGTENGNIMRIDPDFNRVFYAKAGNSKIYCMKKLGGDSMLIARRDAGLILAKTAGRDSLTVLRTYLRPSDYINKYDTVRVYKKAYNYSPYHIHRPDGCDSVFVATSNGLFFFNLKDETNILTSLYEASPVNKIIEYDRNLFLATSDGLHRFNLDTKIITRRDSLSLINLFLSPAPDEKLYGVCDYETGDSKNVVIYDTRGVSDGIITLQDYVYSIHFFDDKQLYVFSDSIKIKTRGKEKMLSEKSPPFNRMYHFVDNDSGYIYLLNGENLACIPRYQNFSKSFVPVSCIVKKDHDKHYIVSENQLYLYSDDLRCAVKLDDLPMDNIEMAAYNKTDDEFWIASKSVVGRSGNNYAKIDDIPRKIDKLKYNLLFSHNDSIYLGDRSYLLRWEEHDDRFGVVDSIYSDLYPVCYDAGDEIVIGTLNQGLFTVTSSGKLSPRYVKQMDAGYLATKIENIRSVDVMGDKYLITAGEGILLADSKDSVWLIRENAPANVYMSAYCVGDKIVATKKEGFDLLRLNGENLEIIKEDNYSSIRFNARAQTVINKSVVLMGSPVGLLRVDVNRLSDSEFIPFKYSVVVPEDEWYLFVIAIAGIIVIVSVLLWLSARMKLKKSRKWYDEYIAKIYKLLGKEDIELFFSENELNLILTEIRQIEDCIKRSGVHRDVVNRLISVSDEFEKKYKHDKIAKDLIIENLKDEYKFFIEERKCVYDEQVTGKIDKLYHVRKFEDFEIIKKEISELIIGATKKHVEPDLTKIRKNIENLREKSIIRYGGEDEETMRLLFESFYNNHIKELIPDDSPKMKTNEIYHACLVMFLINRKEPQFIADLYHDDSKGDLELWRGATRRRMSDYKKDLKSKLTDSKYPDHYIVYTLMGTIS